IASLLSLLLLVVCSSGEKPSAPWSADYSSRQTHLWAQPIPLPWSHRTLFLVGFAKTRVHSIRNPASRAVGSRGQCTCLGPHTLCYPWRLHRALPSFLALPSMIPITRVPPRWTMCRHG